MNTKNQKRGRDEYVGEYEEIKKSDRVNSAGLASYVERNCLMIKDSNFVVVHLEEGRNDGKVEVDWLINIH